MTTPTTTPTPAEQFRADMLRALDEMREGLRAELESVHAELAQIRAGLATASQPAPAPAVGPSATFTANSITLDYMDGKPVYKMRGGQYTKFGVRVWPEVLPALGIDAATLKPGTNPIEPSEVRVLLETKDDDNGQPRTTARKVTSRA